MRKTPRILLAAIMAVSMLSCTAMAATDSPERNHDGVLQVTDGNGTDVTDHVVVTYAGDTSGIADIDQPLAAAQAQLNGVTDFSTLPGITTEALQAALDAQGTGYSASDLRLQTLMDISYVDANDQVVRVTNADITLAQTLANNTAVVILHNPSSNTWEVCTVTFDAAGHPIIDGVPSMSPFAILTATKTAGDATPTPTATATPTPTTAAAASGTTSPQTGEYAGMYVLIAAVALAAAGVVCVKRAKATK